MAGHYRAKRRCNWYSIVSGRGSVVAVTKLGLEWPPKLPRLGFLLQAKSALFSAEVQHGPYLSEGSRVSEVVCASFYVW